MVTNPAIDREREVEHFSCRAVLGAAARASTRSRDEPRTIEIAFPVLLGGHDGLAPLSDETYRDDRPRAQDLPARGPLGGLPRRATRARHLLPRVREHPAARSSASSRRPPRAVRGGAELLVLSRPHRLRGRPPLPRPAPGAGRRGPGAARALRRARRDQPAPALRRRAALGRDPQRARRGAGARPGRRRRLPVRDGRGRPDGRLPRRTSRNLASRAAQGHREGHLHDRHPRGARLRAPVLLDRAQARAHRDLRHARLHRLARTAAPASPSSTPTATSASACWPARTESKPAKTFRFYPKVYKAAVAAANGARRLRRVLARRCASSSSSSRSRCATSST